MHITLQAITYSYPDSPLEALSNLTVSFAEGWTGIVGANGAGKSTLLNILCGLDKPNSGTIMPAITGAYCAQSTENAPENLFDFASDYSPYAVRLRSMLELEDEWIWRYDTLSHGEKKRLQVACALAPEPSLIALDEPTNHLDAETRGVLVATLRHYHGIGLLVSHDRAFLDRLVYQCLFLDEGAGTVVPGNYTEARSQMEILHRTAQAERQQARGELSRIQAESNRRKAEASRTADRRSGRHLDKHDNDGREKLRLAIVSGQDGKAGLLSSQMNKKIALAQKRLDGTHVKKTYDKPLEINTEPAKKKYVAHLAEGSIRMGEDRILRYPELFVGPSDRIGLKGRNGAGKSTLLKTLFTRDENEFGNTSIFIPQEISPEEGRALLLDLKQMPAREKGQVLSIVARLNSSPERLLSGNDLSPGEIRKAMLAVGLLKSPHLIVMDEPTNHLDIHSIEALQEVLGTCNCALLLVSHDAAFLSNVTDITWEFKADLDENPQTTRVVVT